MNFAYITWMGGVIWSEQILPLNFCYLILFMEITLHLLRMCSVSETFCHIFETLKDLNTLELSS